MMNCNEMSLEHVIRAARRIGAHIHKTPIFTSGTVDKITGRHVYFKAENMQKTGSFKIRGALNAVMCLKESDNATQGVVTHSTGNHGQALACAAQLAAMPCSVVIPRGLPSVKVEAIRGYGAEVVFCEATQQSRKETCARVAEERGLLHVPAYDHYDVMAGQGTIGLEICEQVPDLDAVFVMTSGGGLIAGIATAVKGLKPDVKVFAVEVEGKDLQRCLEAGERLWPNPPQTLKTVADATPTQQIGQLPWPIVRDLVEKRVFTVSDEEIIAAMKFTWTRLKTVVEAAGAAPMAAILSKQLQTLDPSIQRICVVLCGGNVDVDNLPW
ncbi:serine racemase-like [Diadema antillarum]|uniref:serine racemase-like n=1 Tax=Diadema antillarum TaxID=105358 RepID=UPI003A84FF1F